MPSVERHLTPASRSARRSQRFRVRLEVSAAPFGGEHGGGVPRPLTIYDLSRDGFLIEAGGGWSVGDGLHVLLPEAGRIEARIARAEPDLFGCTFAAPLSQAQLDRSMAASTVVWPEFTEPTGQAARGAGRQSDGAGRPSASWDGADEPERWPRPVRAAIAVGGALLLWGMIALAIS